MNDIGAFGNVFSATTALSLKRKMELECSNSLQEYQLEMPCITKRSRTDEVLTANDSKDEPILFSETQMVFDPNYDGPKDINFGFTVNTSSSNIKNPLNASNIDVNLPEERIELNGQLAQEEPDSMPMDADGVDESQENSAQLQTDNHINSARNSTCEVIIEDRRFLNTPSFCRPEGMWDTMLDVYMYHGL